MPQPEIGPMLGTGAKADVFAFGEYALKLYRKGAGRREAFREAGILAALEGTGLPVPEVFEAGLYDDRWGLVMSRIEGCSYFDALGDEPERMPELFTDLVALQEQVHQHSVPGLTSFRSRIEMSIERAEALDTATKERLRGRLASMPEGDRLCHGDFHPENIIGEPGTAMIVDWPDASSGDPAADVCRSFLLFHSVSPDYAQRYVEGYAAAAGMKLAAIFAWLPFLAGARLAESSAEDHEAALLEMVDGG